ncbi:MAG TPA: lysophospholipid acyltransferase family protein [Opitutales bacterium]|nr:lysophospholipid acyltransferase family protein [Opitutales bacterium]
MNLIYGTGHFLSTIFFDLFFSGDVAGVESIPKTGPYIIAANHASYLDPPAIGCRVPREMCYFARKTLFKPGLPSWFLHKVNTIPVDLESDTDISSLKTVFRRLKEGDGILLFPEGTRSHDGKLQEGRAGVGMIACRSQVPVVPARIFGSFEAYGRNQRFPNFHTPIDVAFAPPLSFDDYNVPGRGKDRYQAVSEKIMDAIGRIPPPPTIEI